MGYQQFYNPIKVSRRCTVTFGDDLKGKIIGIGNIKVGSSPLIEDVVLANGLIHNLLSITQVWDKVLRVIFDDSTCDVLVKKSNTCVRFGFRENNVYIIDMLNLNCNATYLNAFNEDFGYRIGD